MTNSWTNPRLVTPIRDDVPNLQQKLIALLKQDPTTIIDVPAEAKRLYEVSAGNWQLQKYNGTSWIPLNKLQMDVDKVDGYDATITSTPNTVAVRGADGKLQGDITGNAATASSATTLSQTLPVNKGGTGATTSEQARTNLGVPPTSHASTATTHGVGNASQYGHLKLSDVTNSLSGVSGGIAATPVAVKTAKDAADAAQNAADSAMAKASETATDSKAGIAYFPAPFTVGSDGKIGIRTATISQTGIVQLNNTITSTSSTQAATASAVKQAYDKAVQASNRASLPLGHFFVHPFPTPPDGCLIVNGSLYNRSLYADLFAYEQAQGNVIKEAEWQSIASENGGYCPWFSDGDGSTTFRTPKFAPYQKIALTASQAGQYHAPGLPNIVGVLNNTVYLSQVNATGAFYTIGTGGGQFSGGGGVAGAWNVGFSAQRSNSIYGKSTTVEIESNEWIVCVVAFGVATNVGSVDVANVMSAVEQVQSKITDAIEIEGYWTSTTQFCIRYKNGIQICGAMHWLDSRSPDDYNVVASAKKTTFLKPFVTSPAFSAYSNYHKSPTISDIAGSHFTVYDWAEGSLVKSGSWVAFGTWM